MHRSNPFFSPLSLGITLGLFVLLGFFLWSSGGSVFSPGLLTSKAGSFPVTSHYQSHADFEASCNLCHQPFGKPQAELCEACHTDIAAQVAAKTGLHGALEPSQRCATCHPEHQGRNFDPTSFALAEFDHSSTGFPLTGVHATSACAACHPDGRYLNTPKDCLSCHPEPELHAGMFSPSCGDCHTPQSWKPAQINHATFDHNQLRFVLAKHAVDYAGQPVQCTGCHAGQASQANLSQCVDCHQQHDATFMTQHLADYGQDCLQCHDGADRMHGFSHAQVFPLEGAHATIGCNACHADQRFAGTPSTCSGCHAEPEIHAGFFGTACADCHTSQAWTPALLKLHTFPLNHGQDTDVDCLTCHPSTYASYTCYNCHDHQEAEIAQSHAKAGIKGSELLDCAKCHLDGQVQQTTTKPGES